MKNEGKSSIVKVLLMIPILASFLFGVNSLLIALINHNYLLELVGFQKLANYAVLGICTMALAVVLAIKIFKE